ncbi:tripartite motif-containing protein 3-like [Ptychodera flava]|uniref:tripartite motif-containing protein 3-like n=1 Tax=Ptychodera flava TaxID=63121 RepID=UPI003969E05F
MATGGYDQTTAREESQCQNCKRSKASKFCHDCDVRLCHSCAHYHLLNMETNDHRVETKTNQVFSPRSEVNKLQASHCSVHRNRPPEFFCYSCRVAVCVKCKVDAHSTSEHQCISLTQMKDSMRHICERLDDETKSYIERKKYRERALTEIENWYQEQYRAVEEQTNSVIANIKVEKEISISKIKECHIKSKAVVEEQIAVLREEEKNLSRQANRALELLRSENAVKMASFIEDDNLHVDEVDIPQHSDFGSVMKFERGFSSGFNFGSVQDVGVRAKSLSIMNFLSNVRCGEFVYVDVPIKDIESSIKRTFVNLNISSEVMSSTNAKETVQIMDINEDSINMKFRCTEEGYHRLFIALSGKNIRGSPLTFNVKPEWRYIERIGKDGGNIGEFQLAQCVTLVKKGKLIVVDSGNKRIQRMNYKKDNTAKLKPEKRKPTLMMMSRKHVIFPQCIAVSKENEFHCTDMRDGQIFVCNQKGKLKRWFGGTYLDGPLGIAIDEYSGTIFVACKDKEGDGLVAMFEKGEEKPRGFLGQEMPAELHLVQPFGVCINRKRQVLVCDKGSHRVNVFDPKKGPNGTLLYWFGGEGKQSGQFRYPEGLAVDKQDNVYVCDTDNDRIQKFDREGKFVCCISDIDLVGPMAITHDPDYDELIVTTNKGLFVYG